MRVVMFGPHLEVMGGISAVVQTWLQASAVRGVDLRYLSTMVDGSQQDKLLEVGRCEARLLADLARNGPADLYHIHLSAGSSFWRKLVFFRQVLSTGRPVVVHVHGSEIEPFYEASPRNAAAMRWMFRRAARVIALYPGFAEQVTRWTEGRARVVQLLNPVVIADFLRPPELAWPLAPTVLFMGLIGNRKGTFDLMRAVPEVLRAVPNARFRFGGNGEVDKLEAMARELGVAHAVELLGWVRGDDKVRAFRQATVYCLPSYHEALPVSVLEAMAASLPVVSTTIAGIPQAVLEGETGYLIAPGDVSALAQKLIRVLEDTEAARRMGERGLERARACFDHEVVGQAVVKIWEDAIRAP